MEFKTDALLLRAVDYGESDKIITLLTADRGKLIAGVKGVKKAGAKLRFAAQPFCFAEYVFAEKGGRNTVTSASLYDGFYSLREDVEKFFAGAAALEICDKLTGENEKSAELLVAAVTALKEITEEEPSFALVKFLLKALKIAGYPVRAGACANCGKPLSGRMHFDMTGGAFQCEACEGVPASESTYLTVRAAISDGQHTEDGARRALRLLRTYFNYQTDDDLPAIGEYLKLLPSVKT